MNIIKKSTVLLFALSQFVASAQALLWEKSYGGKHADYLMDAKATPDYGFILAEIGRASCRERVFRRV